MDVRGVEHTETGVGAVTVAVVGSVGGRESDVAGDGGEVRAGSEGWVEDIYTARSERG